MANIRDEDLSRYLAVFHDIYRSTVESLIPRELQANLFRSQFLDTGVYGYISTQLGAGYEYVPGRSRGLSVNHGGARIEDLILDTPKFVRRLRATGIAMGNGVFTLERVGFSDIYPFRLHGEAFVRLVDVDMRAGRWHRHIAYAEIATDRSTEYWSETAAVVRAKDELLVALVDIRELERRQLQASDLSTYLTTFKQKHVLLCGDFKEGRERLDLIRAALDTEGYVPVLLDEIPDEPHQDLRHKFLAVAPAVRFVVIDDSSGGGQMVELELADQGRHVTLILRERGSQTTRSFMTAAASATSAVMKETEYTRDDVHQVVQEGGRWAEATLERLEQAYAKSFPWREPEQPGD